MVVITIIAYINLIVFALIGVFYLIEESYLPSIRDIRKKICENKKRYCANCAHQISKKERAYHGELVTRTYCSLCREIINIYDQKLRYEDISCSRAYCTKDCKWKKREDENDLQDRERYTKSS